MDNQKELLNEIRARFDYIKDNTSTIGIVKEIEEKDRKIMIIVLNKLSSNNSFPNVKSYIQMKSKTHNHKDYVENQYFVSSLK